MPIRLERRARRTYFLGDTYPHKAAIKARGGKWDGDASAWWVGDHSKAEALLRELQVAALVMVTFVKVNDTWCLKSKALLEPGQKVTVQKSDGTTKAAVVDAVLSSDAEGCVASIRKEPRNPGQVRSPAPRRTLAPHGASCSYCGGRECARAWNPSDLCDED